jgi:hypothetical protein
LLECRVRPMERPGFSTARPPWKCMRRSPFRQ